MLIVGLGGILGALARFGFGKWLASRWTTFFPFGTWIINVSGSFLLGILFALHTRAALPEELWLLMGVGFCGAYTTFSTFGYETLKLIEQALYSRACSYVASSTLLGFLFAWLGALIPGVR